ncbi:MAG: hypothetical protein ACLUPK_04525 [Veillonella sp.]
MEYMREHNLPSAGGEHHCRTFRSQYHW